MWIFTSDCFVSIVADKANVNSDRLLVRSRVKGAIGKLFNGIDEHYMTGSDYAYRAWVSRDEVARVFYDYIKNINYTNFKNSIEDPDYRHACGEVWHDMFDYQNHMLFDEEDASFDDGDNFERLPNGERVGSLFNQWAGRYKNYYGYNKS